MCKYLLFILVVSGCSSNNKLDQKIERIDDYRAHDAISAALGRMNRPAPRSSLVVKTDKPYPFIAGIAYYSTSPEPMYFSMSSDTTYQNGVMEISWFAKLIDESYFDSQETSQGSL